MRSRKSLLIDNLLLAIALGCMGVVVLAQDRAPRPHTQVPPDTPDILKRLPVALRNQVKVVEPIDFELVIIDMKNDTITVEGATRIPRKVHLVPHRHVRKPDFWVYEIVAEKDEGVAIQVVTPYSKTLKMGDWKGKRGIEVFGESRVGKKTTSKKLKVIVK